MGAEVHEYRTSVQQHRPGQSPREQEAAAAAKSPSWCPLIETPCHGRGCVLAMDAPKGTRPKCALRAALDKVVNVEE